MTIRYPDLESERNQNLRTSNLELRQLWEEEKARADGYALLVKELRATGSELAELAVAYAAESHSWWSVLDRWDAILAADPEARAAELLNAAREEEG